MSIDKDKLFPVRKVGRSNSKGDPCTKSRRLGVSCFKVRLNDAIAHGLEWNRMKADPRKIWEKKEIQACQKALEDTVKFLKESGAEILQEAHSGHWR